MQNLFETDDIRLSGIEMADSPFPHCIFSKVFDSKVAKELYEWLEQSSLWCFTKTDFYTQFEFSLIELKLSPSLAFLNSEMTKTLLAEKFNNLFHRKLKVVDITVHKLVDGHRMGVHNDFIGKAETHRLVIQINEDWKEENGGYLMFFSSKNPQDVSKVIKPLNNSAIGFEISENSYHAVSTVYNFSRYTLGYTFNEVD